MRVTLAQYQLLSPEEKALVTHIDASVADADEYEMVLRKQIADDQFDHEHEDEGQ
jgi:hypothetical protein